MNAPEIDGIEFLEELGRGGFSVVYKALQPSFSRTIAVKVFALDPDDRGMVDGFLQEARSIGELATRTDVVTVYDTGRTRDGRPYLLLQYLPGGSVADRLRREGPLPMDDVLDIGTTVAEALAAAHGLGILHCDLKPANVLYSAAARPVLADFGVARASAALDRSRSMAFLTPDHAAPELWEGAAPTVSTDLYALGSTLYETVSGTPAFQGGASAPLPLMRRVLAEEPRGLIRPDLPPALRDLVARLMAKDPTQRPSSAGEVSGLLAAVRSSTVPGGTTTPMTGVPIPNPWERPPGRAAGSRTPAPLPFGTAPDDATRTAASAETQERPYTWFAPVPAADSREAPSSVVTSGAPPDSLWGRGSQPRSSFPPPSGPVSAVSAPPPTPATPPPQGRTKTPPNWAAPDSATASAAHSGTTQTVTSARSRLGVDREDPTPSPTPAAVADQLTRKPEKRRNPWLPGIAGGAIGLLVAACVWFFFLRSDPPEPPPRSGAATTTSVPVGLSLTSVAAEGSQRVVQGSFTSPEVVTQLFVQIFEGLPDGTVGRQLGTAVAGTVPSDGGNLLQLVASGESTSFAATLGSYISGDTGDTPLPGGTLCYGATLNATDSEVATQICDPPPGG